MPITVAAIIAFPTVRDTAASSLSLLLPVELEGEPEEVVEGVTLALALPLPLALPVAEGVLASEVEDATGAVVNG